MNNQPIKVLVADDSQVARMLLVHLLESDPQIRVIGVVQDGQAALEFTNQTKPDVVLMDIHMPRLNGFEATRRIMETSPVPIVMCSATTNPSEVATTFRSMEAGALACVEKPVATSLGESDGPASNLIRTIKLMSEVKVVRRWPRSRAIAPVPSIGQAADHKPPFQKTQVIGIGTSTGGPPVLRLILAGLPQDFPVPILIVQHIARGFLAGLVEWLGHATGLSVQIANHGIFPEAGHVYVAPDDLQMGLNARGQIVLTAEEPENGLRPAVSYLFRSLAQVWGPQAVGVLLTGMGKDGAQEMKLLRDRGAITIAQDRHSSVVHGMPAEAIQLGGVTHVLPSDRIAGMLITLVRGHLKAARI